MSRAGFLIVLSLAVTTFSPFTWGATQTHTATFDIDIALDYFNTGDQSAYDEQQVTIPKFNPALGTLTGVSIEVEAEGGYIWEYTWQNLDYDEDFEAWNYIEIAGPGINSGYEDRFFGATIPSSQGYTFSTSDLDIYETYSGNVLQFTGSGDVTFTAKAGLGFRGDEHWVSDFTHYGGQFGTIIVTYTYTPAP